MCCRCRKRAGEVASKTVDRENDTPDISIVQWDDSKLENELLANSTWTHKDESKPSAGHVGEIMDANLDSLKMSTCKAVYPVPAEQISRVPEEASVVIPAAPVTPTYPWDFPWKDLLHGVGDFSADESSTWRFVNSDTKNGIAVVVYTRECATRKDHAEFMLRATLPVNCESYLALLLDWEHRQLWDVYTSGVTILRTYSQYHRRISWQVKLPWPLGQRDYDMIQVARSEFDADTQSKFYCLQTLPVENSDVPCPRGAVRIDDYRLNSILKPLGADRVEVLCAQFEDIKFYVPRWLASRLLGANVPSALADAVEACKAYPRQKLRQIFSDSITPAPENGGESASKDNGKLGEGDDSNGPKPTTSRPPAPSAKSAAGMSKRITVSCPPTFSNPDKRLSCPPSFSRPPPPAPMQSTKKPSRLQSAMMLKETE